VVRVQPITSGRDLFASACECNALNLRDGRKNPLLEIFHRTGEVLNLELHGEARHGMLSPVAASKARKINGAGEIRPFINFVNRSHQHPLLLH
jgi:hypothetical protein